MAWFQWGYMNVGRNPQPSTASRMWVRTAAISPFSGCGNLSVDSGLLLMPASFSAALTGPPAQGTLCSQGYYWAVYPQTLVRTASVWPGKVCWCRRNWNSLPKTKSAGKQCHWELSPTFPSSGPCLCWTTGLLSCDAGGSQQTDKQSCHPACGTSTPCPTTPSQWQENSIYLKVIGVRSSWGSPGHTGRYQLLCFLSNLSKGASLTQPPSA